MTHDYGQHGNAPTTLQQKQALIAAYQRTGNMTAAMREANIHSPRTAYLWWRRYCEAGEAGLQPRSHARHTQQRLSDDLIAQIWQLRSQEPERGRRQIAKALTERYGRQVVSSAGVAAVLRRADPREQAPQLAAAAAATVSAPHPPGVPFWVGGGIDYDRLLELAQTGIRLSLHSEARVAIRVLYQLVSTGLAPAGSRSRALESSAHDAGA